MNKKVLLCIPMLLLSSCASVTKTAPTPAQLNDLLKQKLILISDNRFENLPPSLKENKIIFLGEIHKVKPLAHAADQLVVYLAHDKPVVYALEMCYSLGLFTEAASLGHPNAAKRILIPGCMQEFNSRQTDDTNKIVMTAVDIEHSIFHTKTDPVLFLQDVASRSDSDVALQAIKKEVAQLTEQDTYDKMNRYLKNLKKEFLLYKDTFSPEDQDEISFYFDLLQASNYYQYFKKDRRDAHTIRYRYFIKTIERAYRKAQKRKAILLCRVGTAHIPLDRKMEARYFAKKYSPTKGKVASIRLVPLYYDNRETNETATEKHDDIDSMVKMLMKDYEYSYLSLSELQKNAGFSFKWSKYYSGSDPRYDGLLFVRIEKNSK